MDEGRGAVKILTGKPTGNIPSGKIPLGRSRRRWKGNIRMNLQEIDVNTSNSVDSAQDGECLLIECGIEPP